MDKIKQTIERIQRMLSGGGYYDVPLGTENLVEDVLQVLHEMAEEIDKKKPTIRKYND